MPLALVDHITPRYLYIFEFLFRDVLGLQISLTEDRAGFRISEDVKFNYSKVPEDDVPNFFPSGLLSEQGLHHLPVEMTDYEGLKVFFPVRAGADLPFDPFSMAFFILSRMEEYLPFVPDIHGRFTEDQSLQNKAGLLKEPVVNRIAFLVLDILKKKYPRLDHETGYSFLLTIDVDIAYAHLGKSPWRAVAGMTKLILERDLRAMHERIRTLRGKTGDPYDNFDLHLELAERYEIDLIYFILLGDYGKYDKMLSYRNKRFQDLIRKLDRKSDIGIHPSYSSFGDIEQLNKEVERLKSITGKSVTRHRAHFLRVKFPDTFRDLAKSGIDNDYSLGYSSVNGFRAGTATPFRFYDILKNEVTSLRFHPFIFMDSAMIDHMNLDPEKGEEEAVGLVEKVKKWGGEAVGIWHNYALSEQGAYCGWQQLFRNVMGKATV
jgi:hypothetical protein